MSEEMSTGKKYFLATVAVVAILAIAVFAYQRFDTSTKPPTYIMASSGDDALGLDAPRVDRRGRLYRLTTGDVIICANGNIPTTTTVEVREMPGLMVSCDEGEATPAPTTTMQPTGTAVTPPDSTATPPPPTGSLPLCTSHNPTEHHGLIADNGTCHYDHTHFGDPAQLDWMAELTDSPWPLDQTVSFPHQTPGENALKHTGYIYTVNSTAPNIASDDFECVQLFGGDGCVYAWRIQTHTVGSAHAMNTRIHSIYGQVWVGNPNGTIGSISAGGWVDWGHLTVPYKEALIPTAQDGPFELAGIPYDAVLTSLGSNPYRANAPQFADGPARGVRGQWNMCSNQIQDNHAICMDFMNFRDWGGVDTSNPENVWLVCPDGNCTNNHSSIRPYDISVSTPNELGGGYINFTGWTDLQGNIVDESECVVNEHGVFTCAPLVIKNVFAGSYQFRVATATNIGGDDGPLDKWQEEYDVSPPGEWWIQFPYR